MATATKYITKQKKVSDVSMRRSMGNTLLVWVDSTVEDFDKDSRYSLEQLQTVISQVIICSKPVDCIKFLEGVRKEKAFVIVSSALAQQLVPEIHSMAQVDTICIICDDPARHEGWIKEWPKIKGLHSGISSICEVVRIQKKQCDQDSTPISFVSLTGNGSDVNLNQLDPSFMYTQLFKNTLLQMEHVSLKDFVIYCRTKYGDNPRTVQLINEFEHDYRSNKAVLWYTRYSFIYEMLNRCLRLLEADIIVNMGFYIQDLHRQIKQLHQEQLGQYHGIPFTLYRGQGLSNNDFKKLQLAQGGLISFNSFLSTSKAKELSLLFAESAAEKNETVGILFVMTIDPNITSTPFADIISESHYSSEAEILFSMHTVFRIQNIKKFDDKQRVFEVHLNLTPDDDEELRTLTDLFERELKDGTGLERLGNLLIKVGQWDKAEELYLALLEQAPTPIDEASYNHHLGCIKVYQKDYTGAIQYHESALAINKRILPKNHSDLAISYISIGGIYEKMGEYSKALLFNEKALSIWEEILPENHSNLATCYNNIGSVYDNMKEYSKALSFYEKALSIWEKTLPGNHPDLAVSYNNIGETCKQMGDHSGALSFHEKARSIMEKTLPGTHPYLTTSYANLGGVCEALGDYSKALSFVAKAISNDTKILPSNHSELSPDSAASYNNIEQYGEQLSIIRRMLNAKEQSLSTTDPDLTNVRECLEIMKMLEEL